MSCLPFAFHLIRKLTFMAPTVQKQLLNKSDSLLGRSKSVYQQRNLGTIRARKIEKKQTTSSSSGEMILRVLRLQ